MLLRPDESHHGPRACALVPSCVASRWQWSLSVCIPALLHTHILQFLAESVADKWLLHTPAHSCALLHTPALSHVRSGQCYGTQCLQARIVAPSPGRTVRCLPAGDSQGVDQRSAGPAHRACRPARSVCLPGMASLASPVMWHSDPGLQENGVHTLPRSTVALDHLCINTDPQRPRSSASWRRRPRHPCRLQL